MDDEIIIRKGRIMVLDTICDMTHTLWMNVEAEYLHEHLGPIDVERTPYTDDVVSWL